MRKKGFTLSNYIFTNSNKITYCGFSDERENWS